MTDKCAYISRSARSLASSCTPTPGTYSLVGSHGAGSYIGSHQSGSYLHEPSSLSALNSGHPRRSGSHKQSASGVIRMVYYTNLHPKCAKFMRDHFLSIYSWYLLQLPSAHLALGLSNCLQIKCILYHIPGSIKFTFILFLGLMIMA